MKTNTIYIKNMVCPRCIEAVDDLLKKGNYKVIHVELGKAVLKQDLSFEELSKISELLKQRGFELLQDKNQKIIDEIKTEIIKLVHYDKEIESHVNISNHLAKSLGYDYSYLSNLFSSIMGITIEKYIIAQKIEKAKEFLVYGELSLNEISYKLGYSSAAHLSGQFKKVTGLTPSHFKKIKKNKRKPLDQV